MTENSYTPNYPDILGEITGGTRVHCGLVQVALAIRPRVIRAGRPFEAILLIQNASDIAVDVSTLVHLPKQDAEGKKGRFVCKVDKLVIGLEAGEVGYLTLPISTLPDTAVSADYSITMDLNVKPASDQKPRRIRETTGGGEVKANQLAEGADVIIEELTHLNWTADKVQRFRSVGLEIQFGLLSGTVGRLDELKPGWKSIWTMKDLVDNIVLFQKFQGTLAKQVFPKFKLDAIYPIALESVESNFAKANFPLSQWEKILVSKLLTLVLLYAYPTKILQLGAGDYNLRPYLEPHANLNTLRLPYWLNGYLNLINHEPRAAGAPIKSIFHFCFEDLLRDAAMLAFERIQLLLDEPLGTPKEIEVYISQFISDYQDQTLTFSSVYLPFVVGGIGVVDIVTLPDDDMEKAVHDLREMVAKRNKEYYNENTEGLFQIVSRLMEKVLLKYGFDAKRM